jgi:hypothetical protein
MSKQTITTSMIIEDLANTLDRKAIQEKYGLELWEVTRMFEHPTLKGKRPSKRKPLSFNFVDDFIESPIEEVDEPIVDPNQVTIEQVIKEEGDFDAEAEERDEELTSGEREAKVNGPIDDDDEVEIPSFEDTLDLVKEQQDEDYIADEKEEEIEVEEEEFDTFEL